MLSKLVRDAHRSFCTMLSLELDAKALRAAVHAFAKQTGELHSLSRVDLSLIALAYTLEAAARGTGHLRTSPAPPRAVKANRKSRNNNAPGWGEAGGVWDELDAIEDHDEPGELHSLMIA